MNVLLLPDTKGAAQVLDLLVRWSGEGLLRPFCAWSAGQESGDWVRCVAEGVVSDEWIGEALVDAPPEEIEFVAFYPLAGEEAAAATFADAVEGFLSHARDRLLDRSLDRLLTCTMVVAPESVDQRLPEGLFRASWANLMVAPEDRPAPGGINQLGRDGGRFVPHAAHAIATIAVLWQTPAVNRPDLLSVLRDEPAGPLRVPVRVVRCFSRVVELGFVVDHVAALAFDARGGWPRPGPDFERPSDPARVLAGVTRAFMREHKVPLGRRPFKPIRDVAVPPPDPLTALAHLVRELDAYVRNLPSRLLEEARRTVREKAIDYLEAISASTGRAGVRWRQIGDQIDDLESLNEVLEEEPLVIEDGAVGQVWTDLRQTTLGLVDGSPLPESIQPWLRAPGGRRLVICDPALLAVDPCAEASEAEEDEDAASLPFLRQVRSRVRTAREAAEERLAALGVEEEREEEDDAGEEGESNRRGWPWLRGAVRRITALVLLAVTAGVVAWRLLPPGFALLASFAIALLAVLAAGVAARRAFLRPPIPYDEESAAELRRLNRVLELAQARGDAARLARRCEELDTWIAILSELLHRPWVREPHESVEVPGIVDEETLPAACAVGVTENDQLLLERFGRRARAEAFHPGWLSSVYRRVYALVVEDRPESAGDGLVTSAAADTNLDRESLRRALLDAVLRGDGRRRLDSPVAADLLDAVNAAAVDDLAPTVVPARSGSRPLGPTATWIAPPAGAEEAAAGHEAQVVGVRGWKSSGVFLEPDLVIAPAAAAVDRLMVVAIPGKKPVEVAETTLPESTGLALLRLAEPYGEAVDTVATPPPGAPVVAMEAGPDGLDWRWGVVADEGGVDVVYDGGPPGLGAPVFDFSGNLVGLQGPRESLLSVAPPTELLARDTEPLGASGRGLPPSSRPASAFLRAIVDRGEQELVSAYFVQRGEGRAIELELPTSLTAMDEEGAVGRLSGGAEFLRPLRLMIHRLEATRGVEANQLTILGSRGVEREEAWVERVG